MTMTTTTSTALRDGTWSVLPADTTAAFTVRNCGLIRVRGTIPVVTGTVTVAGGQPVAAAATLDPAGIATGIRKRDSDLRGKHFLDTGRQPELAVRIGEVRPAGEGWAARAWLTVAGTDAPVELTVRREADPAAGTVRVVATGVLDRAAAGLRAPRFLIGRRVAITVTATVRA
jgi:polyisoprenoid-binding protein YceI